MKKITENDKLLHEIRKRRAEKGERTGNARWARRGSVLDYLMSIANVQHQRLTGNKNRIVLKVPKVFSVIDNPDETLYFIALVASVTKLIQGSKLTGIRFNHSEIEQHDLAAEVLLGMAALEVQTISELRRANVALEGVYPEDIRKRRLIRKMGVVKKLRMESSEPLQEVKDVKIFEERGVKKLNVDPDALDCKNRIVTKFVGHINDCLLATNRMLTEDARGDLVAFLGEIIGNAEDHSGATSWHVCGYLDDSGDLAADEIRFCEIVIFNFGKSFAESFTELPADSYALSLVNPYIQHHSKRNFFSKGWLKSDLLTLAALQSNISCKNVDQCSDRGQGTVDLIEFFQKVGRECVSSRSKETKMVLISGNTRIIFDEKYQIRKDEHGREIIAFNENNDLNEVPDKDYVNHLRHARFPGALIAIRFPLKYKDTETVTNQSEVAK